MQIKNHLSKTLFWDTYFEQLDIDRGTEQFLIAGLRDFLICSTAINRGNPKISKSPNQQFF
jgi:hypothetical protein